MTECRKSGALYAPIYLQLKVSVMCNLQAAFHTSIAKWIVLNSKRAVTVLHPYRLGHKGKSVHPAHAK